jgi:hypothetical protein
LVEEEGLSDVFDLRDGAFEVEGLGKDDLEDLMRLLAGTNVVGDVLRTFCTLMLWLVLLKMRLAFMAFANRFAFANISANSP